MNVPETEQKITPDHLARKAMVYLRQSSLQQVKHNQESQRRQYALVDRAKALGFNQIEVIDCDLGVSAGPGAQQRAGFKQLLASVAMGDVGIIFSLSAPGARARIRTGVIYWSFVSCSTLSSPMPIICMTLIYWMINWYWASRGRCVWSNLRC